jgi:hypothetical protein
MRHYVIRVYYVTIYRIIELSELQKLGLLVISILYDKFSDEYVKWT